MPLVSIAFSYISILIPFTSSQLDCYTCISRHDQFDCVVSIFEASDRIRLMAYFKSSGAKLNKRVIWLLLHCAQEPQSAAGHICHVSVDLDSN